MAAAGTSVRRWLGPPGLQKQARFLAAEPGTSLATVTAVANPGSKHLSAPPAVARPVCDEWGFYDPEQAGFEALVKRLLPEDEDAQRAKASALPVSVAGSARQS
jgi:hypothetical protein